MSASQSYNEYEILSRIAEGDENAFGVFFRHYYPLLSKVISVYALSTGDKEDILHETFIRIWLSRDKLTGLDDPASWFCRIASRECLRIITRNGQRQKQQEAYMAGQPATDYSGPEETTRLTQLQRLVTEVVDQMPVQRKRIFLLSRAEGLKPAQIADQLGLSVSTVKNTLVTALKDIRLHLNSAGIDIPLSLLLLLLQKYF